MTVGIGATQYDAAVVHHQGEVAGADADSSAVRDVHCLLPQDLASLGVKSHSAATHSLMLHVDAQRPRDFVEHIQFGLEYTFMNIFSLRGGFEQLGLDEEQGISLGGGLHYDVNNLRFGADYAYTDFGLFGDLNRVAIQVGF